jgi:hypothetical protein
MPLAFVAVWMSLIFGFSAGRIAYDPTIKKPLKIEHVSQLDTVYDVAETKINIEK